jgi:lysine 2,3-aminomutase
MPTPLVSKRAAIYADVPDEKWNDWRWQLSNRLNSAEDFDGRCKLTISSGWTSRPTSSR